MTNIEIALLFNRIMLGAGYVVLALDVLFLLGYLIGRKTTR